MTGSRVNQLQEAVRASAQSATLEEGMERLSQAFDLFMEETRRLEGAYTQLQGRFDKANRDLNQKVGELDRVTTYLESVLSHISQGILFIGRDGVLSTYNQAAEKILGRGKEEVFLKPFLSSFADEVLGFSLSQTLQTERVPEVVYTEVNLSPGEIKDIEVTTKFVNQGPQTSQGLIVLIRDITEVRRLERVANRNDRLKELGEMAASVAHEIRNPLGGIEGFASLLHRDLEKNPESQKMAAYIIEGARTLNQLIAKVLNYTRPLKMHYECVDLAGFLQEALHYLEVDESLGCSFSFETDAPALMVSLDPSLMRSAIFNLALNGAQAMAAKGTVQVRVRRGVNTVFIDVEDTGAGIAPDHLEQIFSPFFTTKHDGNGLGLAEVHKVVRAHGGTIEVISEVGKGTTFTIKLPITIKQSEGVADGY